MAFEELSLGSRGVAVAQLQSALNRAFSLHSRFRMFGFHEPLNVTAVFDGPTANAVRALQAMNHQPATGIVNSPLISLLDHLLLPAVMPSGAPLGVAPFRT